MAGINAILSALSPMPWQQVGAGAVAAGTRLAGTAVEQPGQRPASAGADVVFESGQWWKNRSRSQTGAPDSAPWPGNVAIRAYAGQAAPASVGDAALPVVSASAAAEADQSRPEGEAAAESTTDETAGATGGARRQEAENESRKSAASPLAARKPNGEPMSRAEEMQLAQLRRVDTEVRAHELAHLAAAGAYARGGMSFQYQQGADGQKYAVGGEVSIDTSREADPAKTISKMQVVRSAALAPASPSSQDRQVAAMATKTIGDAETELRLMELAAADEARQHSVAAVGVDAAGQAGASGADSSSGAAEGVVSRAEPPVGAAASSRGVVANVAWGAAAEAAQPDRARNGIDLMV